MNIIVYEMQAPALERGFKAFIDTLRAMTDNICQVHSFFIILEVASGSGK
jgi:hypothetical protein